ncbi:MAG: hypothetical protein AAF704_08435 [Cyanobacteria bacterium P01_D01_bin.123]
MAAPALTCGTPCTINARGKDWEAAIIHLPCYQHPGQIYERTHVRSGLRQLQHLRKRAKVYYECCYTEVGMVEIEDLFSWFLPNAKAVSVVRSARRRSKTREMSAAFARGLFETYEL